MENNGVLALVGGSEWTTGCSFDSTLLAASGGADVVVLPTAAAYQHPERVVLLAAEWFEGLGGRVEGLMVVDRESANDPGMAAVVRGAGFIYLAGGSSLHLKSVLKGSATFEALRQAWEGGAVVAGSAAGAMVLTDPMVDPRGGALTVGLGLVDQLAVLPQFGNQLEDAHGQKLLRTVALAPDGLPVVGIPERSALIRGRDGTWTSEGVAAPVVFLDGNRTEGLDALKG
jgi:cyanophycinase